MISVNWVAMKLKFEAFLLLTYSLLLFFGCATPVKEVKEPKEVVIPPPPREELKELVPSLIEERRVPERLFTLSFRDADIQEVLLALSKQTNYNIVADPDVKGLVTMEVTNVTFKEIMDFLTEPLKLEYKIDGRNVRVFRPRFETRVFTLNYIMTTRKGTSRTSAATGVTGMAGYGYGGGYGGGYSGAGVGAGVGAGAGVSASGMSVGGATIDTGPDTADIWKEIEDGLKTLVSKEGKFAINKIGNTILVTDYKKNLQRIAEFLERVEGSSHRQVVINAQVVEVALSDKYRMGIDWSALIKQAGRRDWTLSQSLRAGTDVFKINVVGEHVSFILDALRQQGQVRILSNPKVSTLNNQKAVIKVGTDEIFFYPYYRPVYEDGRLIGSVIESVWPCPVTIGVVLDVTPQISPDGYITMHIHPSVTDLVRTEEFKQDGKVMATAPVTNIRETDTVVRVKDGQTIIIGGMMQDKKKEIVNKTPLLGSIPGLGGLFRRTEQQVQKTELVILLTPKILIGRRIEELSKEDLKKVEGFKKGFHLGPLIKDK